ncbi:MAG: sigma-70 family RNA polymerase sigma factor [Planctomycetota bacterium]|nr:sigma-70 family RNA polymerase sigma factor [Planctomycetota bacterium]
MSGAGGQGSGLLSQERSISTTLLDQVRARDPGAWQRLEKLYGPVVDQWGRCCGLQDADVADVRQNVFMAVVRAIGSFRRERPADSFRGWLWTITKREVCQLHRQRQKHALAQGGTTAQQQFAELPDDPPDSSDAGKHADVLSGVVRRAAELVRAEFEPRTWQAFWRTTVDGQPAAAVAAELGTTVTAVWKSSSRVKKRIREELEGLLD